MSNDQTTSPVQYSAADVRRWARANGFQVGQRGRLKPDVLQVYQAAQSASPSQPASFEPLSVRIKKIHRQLAKIEECIKEDNLSEALNVKNTLCDDVLRGILDIHYKQADILLSEALRADELITAWSHKRHQSAGPE